MDNYIQQLIGDFNQATLRIIPPSEIWNDVDIEFHDHDEEFCPFSGCCTICSDYKEEYRLDKQFRNRLSDDSGPIVVI